MTHSSDRVQRVVLQSGAVPTLLKVMNPDHSGVDELPRRSRIEAYQAILNLAKGSIPARPDLDMSEFDSCAQQSLSDFQRTAEEGGLVPSMAHGMAVRADIQGAIFDVVTNYFNDDDMQAEEAAERLVNAAEAASF